MTDKNDAMVKFLQTCPTIQNNPLFFNFGNVEDNASQLITTANDVALHKPYIDGSVLKRYTYSVDSFKSVAYNPIAQGRMDENMADIAEVQEVLNWINEQADNETYPDFGTECVIDEMKTLTDTPQLLGVDTTLNPPEAIYRISIEIQYIDNTKKLWN